jgi:ATP-dependent DNA helicase RecG
LQEDRRIERKSCRDIDFNDFAQYYSAFSNTPEGGIVLIGVDDNGAPSGCKNLNHEKLNSLEHFHLSLCPKAKPEFNRVPIGAEGNFVLAVFVPYIGTLVETNRQEAYIRYGDRKQRMSEPEKADFRATRQELSFEQQEAHLKYPQDFDEEIVRAFCTAFREREERKGWSAEEILEDRLLGKREKKQFKPNNALVLLAARQPRTIIPGCRIRIQRFEGTIEGTGASYNPRVDRFVEGNIVRIIRDSSELIRTLNYDVTWLNSEGKFITVPEYPEWAWFEAVVNACVHRSYSFSGTDITAKFFNDRLQIESPGGFVPPVNENNIYEVRAARNPHLMDALRYLGYVRMAREGTRRMRESMRAYDLPEPIFQQEAIHGVVVRVTLRNDHESRKRTTDKDVAQYFGVEIWKALAETDITLLAYAYRNRTINVSEAQRLTGRTWSTSKKDLMRLAKRGLLVFSPGSYSRDPKAHYRIAEETAKDAEEDKNR